MFIAILRFFRVIFFLDLFEGVLILIFVRAKLENRTQKIKRSLGESKNRKKSLTDTLKKLDRVFLKKLRENDQKVLSQSSKALISKKVAVVEKMSDLSKISPQPFKSTI